MVTCEKRDVDRYGRVVALCHAGGTDIGKAMVYYGLALAYRRYSSDYVARHIKWTSFAPPGWANFAPPLTPAITVAICSSLLAHFQSNLAITV
ncbi:MAG: thermonuclease family protein [Proteobacteria bacterium]|nr:thermonuclease family protein [Pseudomonadota bacterium]MDA1357915.1 thermonuclease family protein [Pseudomonadota bacterium]